MKTRLLVAMTLSTISAAIILFFQNCSKVDVQATEIQSASKLSTNCGEKLEGELWFEDLGGIINEPLQCEFGGDLTNQFKKLLEMNCANGNSQQTGNFKKGDLIGQTGACNPANCMGRAEGSIMKTPNGTVKETVPCPDSLQTVVKVYQNLDVIKCTGGKDIKTGTEKGNYIGMEGTCPLPTVTAEFSPAKVKYGTKTNLIVTTAAVKTVSYKCSNNQMGNLPLGGSSTEFVITKDISCMVTAINSENIVVTKEAKAEVICNADQVKENGECKEFACKQFVEIASFPFMVPARDINGICYYSKLFNAIANGPSTGNKEASVIARNHGSGPNPTNPFILDKSSREFKLLGERAIKLSGQFNQLAAIKVDNFLAVGKRLKTENEAMTSWKSYGTQDSTIVGTNYIKINDVDNVLTPFGAAGTATVNALLLTQDFDVMKNYVLDVNALDCGGSRELSNVYLVFQ